MIQVQVVNPQRKTKINEINDERNKTPAVDLLLSEIYSL